MRWVRLITVMGAALALAACDWGPRGPGQLSGIVTTGEIPVGAMILEVRGVGVQGFADSSPTRVFFAETETDVYRLVLVTSAPGGIGFRVSVDDVRAPAFTVTTVEAVDENNAPIADLGGIRVSISR